ncbi:TolC family outer membrane protein [Sphingomonas oryzagri]|uniref:TolC family outer membrane protein n=1 Tax=Sphingomonas oryzagri TaxID=3042314 RepID=A0ABT6MX28_9SPHN|nr:TolC family outer membrane protein [Sphingomonas oryzagri]MDH7637552.1 TolC family outer membrane protein [Sphingomonas oryzagri]
MSKGAVNKRALALLALLATPASGETLAQAVDQAYASNPVLAAARARQESLAETPEQARAGGRLTASADAAGGYDKFDYGKGGAATVSADLPIWTGGRVSSAVRAAQGDVAAGAEGLRDTQAAVLSDVVGAYAELLYDQQAADIARADIELLDHQVAEANARYKLGKATRTDVAQLEAQRASAVATLADAEATLAVTAAGYRATVGSDPGSLAPPPATLATLPVGLDQARDRTLDSNPLYRQSQRVADASSARIDAARANGAPTVSLGGTYGYDGRITGDDHYFPRAASAGVVLHVPILTGGLVASQVRQARADYRAAQFDRDAAAREAVRATESAWAGMQGARAQLSANHDRTVAADLALKGVRAEYGFDLRSTLDILVADESLRAAQLAEARSRSDLLIQQAALLRAVGALDRAAFE